MDPESWDAVMGVHLHGAFHVTRPAFIKMREQKFGRIIMTTSGAGLYGNFGQTNYSAAKMGLVGFMNAMKQEGEKHNIKINTVAPLAATRLTEDVMPPDLLAKVKPEYVAPLVLYLCSAECEDTGMIFNAAMGYFNRVAIVTGPGTIIGDGTRVPTLDEIHRSWDAINDMSDVKEFPSAAAGAVPMVDAVSGQQKKA
jgi:hypothetical protein